MKRFAPASIRWTSLDESIVLVDNLTGQITGRARGLASIAAVTFVAPLVTDRITCQ